MLSLLIGNILWLKLTKLFDEWAGTIQAPVKIALPSMHN
jgi:hypothetical protein